MLRKLLAVMAASVVAVLMGLLTLGTVAGQDPPSASRSLGSESVAAGENVVVTITVSGATQAVVTETLPSGFMYVESSLPDNQVRPDGRDYQFILADSDDNPFTYTVAVSEAGMISGKLRVDRVDYDFDDSSDSSDSSVTIEAATTPTPTPTAGDGPSASRSLDSGSVAAGGENVVVTITVEGATQAVVTETLPSGFTYVESSLPDNQVRPDGRDYQFILADSDDNPFTYTVAVSEAGTISGKLRVDRVDYDFDDSSVTVEGGPSASRSLDSGSVAAGGENVVVTITVEGATQAVVTETLPSGFTYVESSLPDNQVRPDGRDYQFILADSDDNPFTYTVAVSEAGTISGKLRVDRVDYDFDDSSVTVEGGPSASRSLDSGSVAAGGENVVVTITVEGATQAVVTETLPSGFTYVESSLPDNQVRPDGRDYQFILADSADNPFTYTVAVSEAGTISGKLRVDRVDYDFDDSSVTVEGGPSASRSLDSGSVAAGGENVVVTITVEGATQAVVTETLPSGFTYVESSLSDNQVRPDGRDYRFILADSDDNPFTYTVAVSEAGTISGKLRVDRVDYELDESSVTIEAPSTDDMKPDVTWNVPQALVLNVRIRPISPITEDDIASYAIEKGQLPRVLRLDETTGVITGRPGRETSAATTVTIEVCDTSGNCASFDLRFPRVVDPAIVESTPTPTLPRVPEPDLTGVTVGGAAPSSGLQIALAAAGGTLLLGGAGIMAARRRARVRVKR